MWFKNIHLNLPAKKKHLNGLKQQLSQMYRLFAGAVCDLDGLGKLDLMLYYAYVREHYYEIFRKLYIMNHGWNLGKNPSVCIDCGGHVGVFADIALHCGAITHIFEPNIYLFEFLKNKYANNHNVFLHNKAVSNRAYRTSFLIDSGGILSQGNRIVKTDEKVQESYEVEVIDLSRFISEDILPNNKIAFLKLDVEGAEFDIMESLLAKGLHEKIDYIACETHERFFKDSEAKISRLKEQIASVNAKNIFLDWI